MNRSNSSLPLAPICPGGLLTRRDFLKSAVAAAASLPALAAVGVGDDLPVRVPRAPTALGFCPRYDFVEVKRVLGRMLDELQDARALVRNKNVTIKVNLVNSSAEDLSGVPLALSVVAHPVVARALGSLLVEYGARRVTYCDQLPVASLEPDAFAGYGYKLDEFDQALQGRVRFQNTRNLGPYPNYALVKVPGGPELATAWEVNRTYVDTDVLVSLAKLKSHVSGGITGGMKNLFGIPPSSLYGDDLKDEPDEGAVGYRNQAMHNCSRKPFTSVSTFTGHSVQGDHGFNVPRFIVDLNAAFPVQLVVIDGISTIQAAEGWWLGSMVSLTRPGLLLAGRNPVCTDSVAAAVMGFNPDAPDRTWPFVNGTNHLALARRKALGENRLSELDITGMDLAAARFQFQPTYRRTNS